MDQREFRALQPESRAGVMTIFVRVTGALDVIGKLSLCPGCPYREIILMPGVPH